MNLLKNIFLSIVTLSVMATFCACSDLENTAPEMMVDIYKTQSGNIKLNLVKRMLWEA